MSFVRSAESLFEGEIRAPKDETFCLVAGQVSVVYQVTERRNGACGLRSSSYEQVFT